MDNDKVIIQWNDEQIDATSYVVYVKRLERAVFEVACSYDVEGFKMALNEKEQLFAKFYSGAVNKANQMTMEQLISWIDELEEIIFEAKAAKQGADEIKKQRVAKLRADEREKIRTQDNNTDSEKIITAVEKRKDRMTKVDKLAENLRNLGHSEEDIKKILGTIAIDETKQVARNNVVSFNGKDKSKVDVDKVIADAGKQVSEPSEVFDPSKLFG